MSKRNIWSDGFCWAQGLQGHWGLVVLCTVSDALPMGLSESIWPPDSGPEQEWPLTTDQQTGGGGCWQKVPTHLQSKERWWQIDVWWSSSALLPWVPQKLTTGQLRASVTPLVPTIQKILADPHVAGCFHVSLLLPVGLRSHIICLCLCTCWNIVSFRATPRNIKIWAVREVSRKVKELSLKLQKTLSIYKIM